MKGSHPEARRPRWEVDVKPEQCPVCGSQRVAEILYGLPAFSEELEGKLKAGEVLLGGCVLTGDDPSWVCLGCGTEFFRRQRT